SATYRFAGGVRASARAVPFAVKGEALARGDRRCRVRSTLAAWVFPFLLAAACCCRRDACRPCGPVAAPVPMAPPAVAAAPAAAPAKPAPPPAAPVAAKDTAAAAKSGDEGIHATLKEKKIHDLEFHDASLEQVAQYIHTVTGVPVTISPK